MKKLLVNTPSGIQEIIEVGEGGGYFDDACVIWDESIDGEMPTITIGGMVRNGNTVAFDQARMDQHAAANVSPIPRQVTMRQARLAIHGAGLLDAVANAIVAAGMAAQIEWEYAGTVERNSGIVPAMATALGLTDAQIDALFIAAGAL